jgi:iron(II)-dependent oxidoreductase
VKRRYPWGEEEPGASRANLATSGRFGPTPAGSFPVGASPWGCRQMIGDVWEWTASDFLPYPGFRSFPYREYSEVFFGSDYKVLRGGSWATHPTAVRTTFRNWDFPIRRQIFAGFRCARDA